MNLKDQLQETLGNAYELERELGGGGMSRVFVADEKRLRRKVVIKVLSPELAAGVSADRFEREIQLAASLQQANIVPILAAGETRGLPFYTMPFVDGESLRQRLKDGALPIPVVINTVRDVARALSYAHGQGVVHRDIKPDNVLVSGGTAVVTDFGIAKAISDARASDEGNTLTQLGTSLGTPAYMSPEQAAGDPSVDSRADIYSLGCMAYELLTGQAPFHGRTPARTLAAHMTEEPRPVAELRPETPASLADLVHRCLAKEPSARPQSAGEIADALEQVTSPGIQSMPTLDSPGMLRRTLVMYFTAILIVAIVTRAAIIAIGLPDWVLPGAMVVMLLGLPVILFTWYVNRTVRRVATTTPALTPGGTPAKHGTMATIALKASPHVSWRRTAMGGAIALGAFVLLVGGFMLMRALGIGPAGSLFAAGKLDERDRVIVTEFQSPDSSLGTLVTEAVRTNLGQSRVVSIMPPVAIGAALQRMQRPVTSELDFRLAREIALREGVKAIVDGAIRPLAGGYVVSMRLVSTDSASELAAFQETADGPRELLEKLDELTRKLRGRIGESLLDVRGSAPLEQVTTRSIEALRIYAEAARYLDRGGSPVEASERLREAVRIDSTFAMAWRKLGVAYSNGGMGRARIDSALEKAYQYRDRLTEKERLMAEGTYYQLGPGRDRRRAIRAYEQLLAIDPTEQGAANNLASIFSGRRDFVRAESLFKAQIDAGRASVSQYTNLLTALYNNGKREEAERLAAELRQKYPQSPVGHLALATFAYDRQQYDSVEKLFRGWAADPNIILKINGVAGLASYSLLRGRPSDTRRHGKEAERIARQLGVPMRSSLNDSIAESWLDMLYYGDTTRAVRRVDAALASSDWRAVPFESRPYGDLAAFYGMAGRPAQVRRVQQLYDAELTDSTIRRMRQPEVTYIAAMIARAEGRYPEAARLVWSADTTYDGPDGNCTVCIFDDLGWVYDAAGLADSAIHYWERYLETPYFARLNQDGGQRPLIVRRMGELHEAKGDIPAAVRYYRDFVSLWERAEPQLQPKVAEVRRRISRLADTETRGGTR